VRKIETSIPNPKSPILNGLDPLSTYTIRYPSTPTKDGPEGSDEYLPLVDCEPTI
jgi:hypothetical protein